MRQRSPDGGNRGSGERRRQLPGFCRRPQLLRLERIGYVLPLLRKVGFEQLDTGGQLVPVGFRQGVGGLQRLPRRRDSVLGGLEVRVGSAAAQLQNLFPRGLDEVLDLCLWVRLRVGRLDRRRRRATATAPAAGRQSQCQNQDRRPDDHRISACVHVARASRQNCRTKLSSARLRS